MFREIGDELMPEAIAVFKSSRLKSTWTKASIVNFIARTFDERKIIERSWNLAHAISIVRLYYQIKSLAINFATQAKLCRYKDGGKLPCTISKSELNRYERAFYRFELYCNLFHDLNTPIMSLEEQRVLFFSKFSPWENEQLACVHAYLIRLLFPGRFKYLYDAMSNAYFFGADFDEMVEHDVRWGQMYVHFSVFEDQFKIAYMEPILAHGLASICFLQSCTGFDQKVSIMCPDKLRSSNIFLYHALEAASGSDDRLELEDYTAEEEIKNISPPYFKDPDSGSENVWRLMHEMSSRAYFINSEGSFAYREWGYVMWDRNTLEEMGNFEDDWDELGRALWMKDESMELRRASLTRREEIYRAGGRGWWSFDDESKILWPDGKEPAKIVPEEKPKPVQTLEEAKAFILSLKYLNIFVCCIAELH